MIDCIDNIRGDVVVQKRLLILLTICLLLISIIMGGCTDMQSKAITAKNNYPDRPITVIVPFSAGGGLDLVARTLEKMAPKYLGQPLVVINKLGGDGTSGWNELASASPDGYTLGMSVVDLLIQPLYGSTRYHYPTALDPIAQVATLPQVMVVSAEHSWKDIDDVIKYAKKNPGQLKCGNGGIGSTPHILGETLAKVTGITIEQVPFRGASEEVVAILGNHIEIGFVNPATVKEQIKNGTLVALATTGEQRLTDPDLAQIPTFKEQGFDIVLNNWFGVVAPKELPPQIKTKLEEGFKAMIADPEFKASMENVGLEIEYLNSDDSKEKWYSDGNKLAKTIQETGILEQIKAQKN
jgi:tripartite-type tricarboxylate transporter receptor subunit TctC